MEESKPEESKPPSHPPEQTWYYPSRSCRICFEEVAPTVSMYPPGVAMRFQRPVIEYKSDDDGRLIKPCLCKGSARYVHEMCLLRSRTAQGREKSMWQCDICKHKFNFQRLTLQRFLGSYVAASFLTAILMIVLMFVLGFIADPIINLWIDPLDTLMGRESLWEELHVESPLRPGPLSAWSQHFMKGLISMGLVGFLKTLLLNPFHWWNMRNGAMMGGGRTATTGRDRALNISWIAVVLGICSAFYFFYKWVRTLVQHSLKSVGNHIVDTQLPDDDADLKPPPGWAYQAPQEEEIPAEPVEEQDTPEPSPEISPPEHPLDTAFAETKVSGTLPDPAPSIPSEILSDSNRPFMSESWVDVTDEQQNSLDGVHRQGWSFANL